MATNSCVNGFKKYFWGLEMYESMLKEKALKEERKRPETIPQNEIAEIQHFSHSHPLTYTEPDYDRFICNSCERKDEGKRYHCAQCEFDLHLACASIDITTRLVHHMPPEEMAAYGVDQETIVNSFAHAAHDQGRLFGCASRAVAQGLRFLGSRNLGDGPAHDLVTEYKRQSFKCAHCNNSGDGLRFCCDVCDVQLHRVCAKNPTQITSYLHPKHELELKLSRPCFAKCDLCGYTSPKHSLMYGCYDCELYLHPGCTQWPLYLAHPLHPPHLLVLKPCGHDASSCSGCGELIGMYNSYKYNCKPCGLDFHLSCILRHSKLGIDQEVERDYYPGQCIALLPVTNLILPNTDWKKPYPEGLRWSSYSSLKWRTNI